MRQKRHLFKVILGVVLGLFALAAPPAGHGDDRGKEGSAEPKKAASSLSIADLVAHAKELKRQLNEHHKGTSAVVTQMESHSDAWKTAQQNADGLSLQAAALRSKLILQEKATMAIAKMLQDEKDAHVESCEDSEQQFASVVAQAAELTRQLAEHRKATAAIVEQLQDEKDAHAVTRKAAKKNARGLAAQAAELQSKVDEQQKATATFVAQLVDAKDAHAKVLDQLTSERELRKALEKQLALARGARKNKE